MMNDNTDILPNPRRHPQELNFFIQVSLGSASTNIQHFEASRISCSITSMVANDGSGAQLLAKLL